MYVIVIFRNDSMLYEIFAKYDEAEKHYGQKHAEAIDTK
jgi:hypothetical protein